MKLLLALALLLSVGCELEPRRGAEPVVTGIGRSETSVKF